MNSILFVHGFNGDEGEYQSIIKYLKKRGFSNFYEFVYGKNLGQVPIKNIAKELSEFIEKNIRDEEIDIIAMSQGGVVALAFLQYYKNKKIGKLFNLCTPYKGSFWAYFLKSPGGIDLRPNSALLKGIDGYLKNNNIDIYSVYTPFDLMVFPGWNAKPRYGKTKMIFAPIHPFAFFWRSTKKFIYKNLLK